MYIKKYLFINIFIANLLTQLIHTYGRMHARTRTRTRTRTHCTFSNKVTYIRGQWCLHNVLTQCAYTLPQHEKDTFPFSILKYEISIYKMKKQVQEIPLKPSNKPTLTVNVDRRRRRDQTEVLRILNGYGDIDRNMFFNLNEGSRARGHKVTLVKKQYWLDVRKYSFSQRMVTAGSKHIFK